MHTCIAALAAGADSTMSKRTRVEVRNTIYEKLGIRNEVGCSVGLLIGAIQRIQQVISELEQQPDDVQLLIGELGQHGKTHSNYSSSEYLLRGLKDTLYRARQKEANEEVQSTAHLASPGAVGGSSTITKGISVNRNVVIKNVKQIDCAKCTNPELHRAHSRRGNCKLAVQSTSHLASPNSDLIQEISSSPKGISDRHAMTFDNVDQIDCAQCANPELRCAHSRRGNCKLAVPTAGIKETITQLTHGFEVEAIRTCRVVDVSVQYTTSIACY